jgi:hypothetical protein
MFCPMKLAPPPPDIATIRHALEAALKPRSGYQRK